MERGWKSVEVFVGCSMYTGTNIEEMNTEKSEVFGVCNVHTIEHMGKESREGNKWKGIT
jgi:hypothetical protein